MKKVGKSILAILLCISMVLVSVVSFGSVQVSASDDKYEIPEWLDTIFDKIVNLAIRVIHKTLIVIRRPWEPKSGNTLDMSKFADEPTWSDEFTADHIRTSKWGHYSQGRRKGGYWDESQSFVRDGNLVIRTEYKEDGRYGPGYYADRLATRYSFEQKYGYFECRCKLPAAQGLWAAFWVTTRIKDNTKPEEGTEIDVFESPMFYRAAQGLDNNMVSSNLHYGGYKLNHRYKNVAITKVNNPYTEFNTYGVEWNEDGYIFYINGVETGRSNFGGVTKVPQYIILSTEIDGANGKPFPGWSGIITDNEEGALPAEFIVDYVRVYQYKDLVE